MCSIYGGFGTLSYCYDFDEASGTTLVDGSGAGHNGTISASGVTYHATGLTSNSVYAETTDGTSGSMTGGVAPTSGSFSLSFFVNLHSNANNWARLVATGNPAHSSPSSGLNIGINSTSTNNLMYAVLGYGTGSLSFGNIPLPLNTTENVTLTYNATGNVATLCVGSGSSPKCVTANLSGAYVATGNALVFGGGSVYYPANATFDEAGYWQGTVLTTAQIDTIASNVGTGATPSPTPAASPSPSARPTPSSAGTPTPAPSPTSSSSSAPGMCSIYGGSGPLSFCYDFNEASGTALVDASGAGHNGTISATGVTYHASGLTSNSVYAETTDGTSGSMTSGIAQASGSFSLSFFVNLHANANNWARLVATGNPAHSSPASGLNLGINSTATNNQVYAVLGYGSGSLNFGNIPLPLNTTENVTLTYNASGYGVTLCVGNNSFPTCVNATLPSAFVASGNPLVFGGGTKYYPANATFDEAAYWQGTVLTAAQIDTIAAYSGTGVPPSPTPTPSPSPVPTATPVPTPMPSGNAFNDWATYGYDAQRSGFNPNTAGISPVSVASHLHLAWQVALGGAPTQPLVATNVAGHAALVIVGRVSSMYAFDAVTGALVWGPVALQSQNLQLCGSSGVAGTAYYDAALGAVFVAAGNGLSPNHVVLYELSASSGAIVAQVDVTPTLLPGESVSAHTAITFANGLLYLGTGSNCEEASWRGRVVAVNPSTVTVENTFFTTYGVGGNNYGGGGIWAWGGVSADGAGNIYAGTGNAETSGTANSSGPAEALPFVASVSEQGGYAEHLIKLSGDLSTLEDSNYPGFNFTVGHSDLDYTGVPVLFQPSGCDLMSATQSKGGTLVVNDTTNLSTPVSYLLSMPSGVADYIGNPGYSPATGLLYAAAASSQGGALEPPGMVALQFSGCSSSILWESAFGPDSFSYESNGSRPRSAPTVTAGGVVFMGTPCTPNGTGGCGAPTATKPSGAVWAIDASSGTVLNGGNPVLITPDHIRMAPTADGLWLWVYDNSGNLYGMTVDPTVPAIQKRAGHIDAVRARYPL